MTEEEIKQEILMQFGAPVVKVEIDDTQWPTLFKRAKRWFQAKKGLLKCGLFAASPVMAIPADALKIIDVILPGAGGGGLGCLMTLGFFDDIVPADVLGRNGQISTTFNNYSQYVQLMQQLETVRRIFNSDPDWSVQCDKLYLTGVTSGQVLIIWKRRDWGISELQDRDEDLIYRYCLNEARYVLARIRGKYPSYPSAGGSVEMDASVLLEEYNAEKELLEEEIGASAMPIPFITG